MKVELVFAFWTMVDCKAIVSTSEPLKLFFAFSKYRQHFLIHMSDGIFLSLSAPCSALTPCLRDETNEQNNEH